MRELVKKLCEKNRLIENQRKKKKSERKREI